MGAILSAFVLSVSELLFPATAFIVPNFLPWANNRIGNDKKQYKNNNLIWMESN